MIITQFGGSVGRCLYFLLTEKTVFHVSFVNYEQCVDIGFTPYSLLDKKDQDRVWDCWKESAVLFETA